jgi:ribosomal protein L37AE/L43A
MIHPQRIWSRCPYCKKIYAKSLSTVRLGPGTHQCAKCKNVFADGSIEWKSASRSQKREYLFPMKEILGIFGSIFFTAVLAFLGREGLTSSTYLIIFTLILVMLPLIFRLLRRILGIRQSIKRQDIALLRAAGYRSADGLEAGSR